MTMAYHVYDSTYCQVIAIPCCDMESEDNIPQHVMWENLNAVMAKSGLLDVHSLQGLHGG